MAAVIEAAPSIVPWYRGQGDDVTIYHGDCHKLIPDILAPSSVDLVLTDPPYGDTTHTGARTDDGKRALIDFASTTAESLRDTIALLAPYCRGWFVATMEWQHIAALERQPPTGWRFVRFGLWIKCNSVPQFSGDRPSTGWEGIAILHREGGRMRWNGGGKPAVWTYNKVNGAHPTQKPIGLVRELVALFSNPGDLILDPFFGSGTSLRASKDLGRRAIGVEIDEQNCRIAAGRMQQATLQMDGLE